MCEETDVKTKKKKIQKKISINLDGYLSLADLLAMDDEQCRHYYEKIRWPFGRICPYCGFMKSWEMHKRIGYYKCAGCRGQFTVRIGTMMQDSHISIRKWLMAIFEMCSAKKGISSMNLQRNLGLSSYESAWFLSHRIRCAMVRDPFAKKLSGVVEIDEIYIGNRKKGKLKTKIEGEVKLKKLTKKDKKKLEPKKKTGRGADMQCVVVMVERGGETCMEPIERLTIECLSETLVDKIALDAETITDKLKGYNKNSEIFAEHHTVTHSKGVFAKGEFHVNTAESRNSLLRRGYYGTFHQFTDRHLHRYLVEFSYRWSNQNMLTDKMMRLLLTRLEGRKMAYKRKNVLFPVYTFKQVIRKV